MLKVSTFVMLLACVFQAQAQSVDREVVGSDGGQAANSDVYWEWNLGETVTGTFPSDGIFTQGFEQSDSNTTNSAIVPRRASIQVQMFSNPLSGFIHLDLGSPGTQWSVELFDVSGKSLETKTITVKNQNGLDLDVSRYGGGRFLLKIKNAVLGIDKTFTFSKTR